MFLLAPLLPRQTYEDHSLMADYARANRCLPSEKLIGLIVDLCWVFRDLQKLLPSMAHPQTEHWRRWNSNQGQDAHWSMNWEMPSQRLQNFAGSGGIDLARIQWHPPLEKVNWWWCSESSWSKPMSRKKNYGFGCGRWTSFTIPFLIPMEKRMSSFQREHCSWCSSGLSGSFDPGCGNHRDHGGYREVTGQNLLAAEGYVRDARKPMTGPDRFDKLRKLFEKNRSELRRSNSRIYWNKLNQMTSHPIGLREIPGKVPDDRRVHSGAYNIRSILRKAY